MKSSTNPKRPLSVASSLPLALAAVLLFALPLQACNVPVFRYALEHWRPDPYEVIVFHRGALDPGDRESVRLLGQHAAGAFTPTNIAVKVVDLDTPTAAPLRKLFEAQVKPALPWVVVRNRNVDNNKTVVWAGKLSARSVRLLLDSPLRRELVKRLLDGATAVWVHVGSGDREKDDASAQLLATELRRLSSELKLPKLTDSPEDKVSDRGPPLRVAFSMVRLRRGDPDEQFLLQCLLNSEPELARRKEPMAFAVFGRGRCLAALIGAGLNARNIKSACASLLAPCTCDVQTEMEWFDLLTTAGWQIFGTESRSQEPGGKGQEPGIGSQRTALPSLGRGPWPMTPADVTPPPEKRPLVPRWVILAGISVAMVLVLLMGKRVARSGQNKKGA